ncbi:MAG: pyridoxal phosphate-dependent aminotransferase [Rhodobacteraceae bacterium]|nr:pyridoxal phosphate-dependent aminotransferase [Paracoccaceae bacterium]
MQLSYTLSNLTPGGDDGWGLFYEARRRKAAGEAILELTIGEHDIPTHETILNAMHRAALAGHTGYAAVPGVEALRQKVARRLEERTGVATGPENVVITPGGQAGLFAAHKAVLDAGDVGLYLDPFYATYPGTLRGSGAEARAIACHPEHGFQPQAADIRAAAQGAKSLLINTPNNPTGVVYTRETLEAVAQVCRDEDIWLISDEVYDTQIWEGEHISPRTLPGMAERTLVIGSMSKSHAMTGSRVGWIVGPEEVISHLINLATHTTYGVPGYIQDAALFALNEGPWLEDEVGAPFRRRRDMAERLIAQQNVVSLVPSGGAMYLMLDMRATGLSGQDFAQQLLDAHGIAVMPGESFGRAAAGHVRVAMTLEDTAFEEALSKLLSFAETLA